MSRRLHRALCALNRECFEPGPDTLVVLTSYNQQERTLRRVLARAGLSSRGWQALRATCSSLLSRRIEVRASLSSGQEVEAPKGGKVRSPRPAAVRPREGVG